MKSLLIFLLLFGACVKKQEKINIESTIVSKEFQEYINKDTNKNTTHLVATYNNGLDLTLVQYFSISNNVYWDSNKNIFYGSTSFEHTNNIIYHFDPVKATNFIYYTNRYDSGEFLFLDKVYKYVGSLSLLERIYIDTNNPPQQYINKLAPIDDSEIICYDNKKFFNNSLIYPSTITLYTNKQGEKFYRTEKYTLTPVEPNEFRYKNNLIEIPNSNLN